MSPHRVAVLHAGQARKTMGRWEFKLVDPLRTQITEKVKSGGIW
jgi:hypothetical protein